MQISSAHTASGLPWRLRHEDARAALAIAQQHGVSELLAGILVGRHVAVDDVPQFLNPTLRDYLPDPFHLLDMDKAVTRILTAINENQPIAVFGDYDVDGATSTALLMQYLGAIGARVMPYIPDRMAEGYGPTIGAFEKLIEGFRIQGLGFREGVSSAYSPPEGESLERSERGDLESNAEPKRLLSVSVGGNAPTEIPPPNLQADLAPPQGGSRELVAPSPEKSRGLIITVDCGTLAHAPIAFAQERGVDVIVLDHHLSSGALPNAHAIVNPNRVDESSPHRNLAAVGVTFLTLVALNQKLRDAGFFAQHPAPNLLALLDIVALGTVCDVMPLTGLNRAFVAQGLKVMAQRRSLGLSVLSDVSRMDESPNVYHLGFLLGPRINAGGRVGKSSLGVELLTATEDAAAREIAQTLDVHNAERQAIEAGVLEQAMAAAEQQRNMPVLLVAGQGWHEGVIGIVAGRLKEKFSRPAIVVALKDGMGKASARSVTGVDMGAAVHAAVAEGLIEKGGGHAMAAGFSAAEGKLQALHSFLIARMEVDVAAYTDARVMTFDGTLSVAGANLDTLDEMALAGPYGLGNPSPRFVIPNARIAHVAVMKEKHLRVTLADESGTKRLNAVAFGAVGTQMGAWLMAEKTLHILGELKRNRWQGSETAQLLISDVAKAV